jgi:hypothetical protein
MSTRPPPIGVKDHLRARRDKRQSHDGPAIAAEGVTA